MGDLNACVSQLDHGFTITDADFLASDWSKWIRGMLGLGELVPRSVLAQPPTAVVVATTIALLLK